MPEDTLSPFGMVPGERAFTVVGTVEFGFYEVDTNQGFIAMDVAKHLLRRTSPDLIQLRLANMDDAPRLREELQRRLGPPLPGRGLDRDQQAVVRGPEPREEGDLAHDRPHHHGGRPQHRRLAGATRDGEEPGHRDPPDHGGARAGDPAHLHAPGAHDWLRGHRGRRRAGPHRVHRAPTAIGSISLPGDVYQISYLPFRVQAFDVVVILLSAVGVCFLATIYPARQAGRLDPAEALRNQ